MTSLPGVPSTTPSPVISGVRPKHEVGSADAVGAPTRANMNAAAVNATSVVRRTTMRRPPGAGRRTPARANTTLLRIAEAAQEPQTARPHADGITRLGETSGDGHCG